jgi:hypothetical protein
MQMFCRNSSDVSSLIWFAALPLDLARTTGAPWLTIRKDKSLRSERALLSPTNNQALDRNKRCGRPASLPHRDCLPACEARGFAGYSLAGDSRWQEIEVLPTGDRSWLERRTGTTRESS